MSIEHTVDATQIHHDWDNTRSPAVVVQSGDVVHFDLPMTGQGQVSETSKSGEVAWDFDTIYNLGGPVHVEGAKPGDVLEVEILELEPGPWGWTTVIPELGLLPDDFPEPYLKIFDLRNRDTATVAPGVEVPIGPFLGTMGVHTDDPGQHSPFPPHKGAGNVDNRHLIAGSTLWVPIWCEGALFSCGDAHAAQGDGEVCVTGIECPMRASLRFGVLERSLPAPRFRTPHAVVADGPYYGTMGIHADLMEGARIAVRSMIDWLAEERGLSREDAYVLCSLAGDLRILEIVDAGVWNVGMSMPLGVFA
jgi:acetamidase/formamidase